MGDVKVRGACAGNEERLTPVDRGVFLQARWQASTGGLPSRLIIVVTPQ
jgi:hypothetical protein